MEDPAGKAYTDEEVNTILSGPSLLTGIDIPQTIASTADWDNLTEQKREQIRTILHGVIMTEYLREKAAP